MKTGGKREWSKPECNRIKLVPEEAVLWGCKVVTGAVARDGWYGTCITGSSCPTLAS